MVEVRPIDKTTAYLGFVLGSKFLSFVCGRYDYAFYKS